MVYVLDGLTSLFLSVALKYIGRLINEPVKNVMIHDLIKVISIINYLILYLSCGIFFFWLPIIFHDSLIA